MYPQHQSLNETASSSAAVKAPAARGVASTLSKHSQTYRPSCRSHGTVATLSPSASPQLYSTPADMSHVDVRADSRRQMLSTADYPQRSNGRCCGRMTSLLTSSVCVGVLFVAYVFAGAFMFKEIELRNEVTSLSAEEMMTSDIRPAIDDIWRSLNLKAEDFRFNATTTSASGCQLATILRRLQMQAVLRSLNAMSPWDLPTQRWNDENTMTGAMATKFGSRRWSLPGAVLFTVSTLTTVGYSGATPRTVLGRLLTIPYAAFGIPLTFYFLSRIGRDLAVILRTFYRRVCCDFICCKLCQRRQRRKLYEMTSSLNGDIAQPVYVDRTLSYRASVEADHTSSRSAHVYESIGSRGSARKNVSKSQVLTTADATDDLTTSGRQRSTVPDQEANSTKARLMPVRSDPLMNRLAVTPAPTATVYATESLPSSKRRSPRLNKLLLDRYLLNSAADEADNSTSKPSRRRRHSEVRRTTSEGVMATTTTTRTEGTEGKSSGLAITISPVNETTSLDRRKTKLRSTSSSAAVAASDPAAAAGTGAKNKTASKWLSVKAAVASPTTKVDKTTPNTDPSSSSGRLVEVAPPLSEGCRNSTPTAQQNNGVVGLTPSSRRLVTLGRRPSSVAIAAVRHGRRAPSPGKRKDKSAFGGARASGRSRKLSDRHTGARSAASADPRVYSVREGRTATSARRGSRSSGGCFGDFVRIGSLVSYDSDESYVTASNSTPTTSRKLLGNNCASKDNRYAARVGQERLVERDIDDEVVIETSEVFIDGPKVNDVQQHQHLHDDRIDDHLIQSLPDNVIGNVGSTSGTMVYSPRSISSTYGIRRVPSSSHAAVPLPLCIAVLFSYLIGGAALFVHIRQNYDCFSERRLLADAVDEDWLTGVFVSFAALTTVGGWYPTPCNSSLSYGNDVIDDDFQWPPDERYVYAAWLVGGLSLVAMAVIIVLDCIFQGPPSCPLNTCCNSRTKSITPVDV